LPYFSFLEQSLDLIGLVFKQPLTVRAKDPAGNIDPTPASYTWTVDNTAPETQIDSQPANPSNSASASFSFSSTDLTATFECALDGAAFAACASPQGYSALAEGTHSFAVRAKDAIGNVDSTPAAYTWTVDTTAPETQIDTHPTDPGSASASFGFSSTDLTATFECALDGAVFAACASPKDYSALADGAHTFSVRARDAAGNVDATPASYAWTVDNTMPETQLNSHPADPSGANASFTFSSPDPTASFECALDGAVFTACASPQDYSALSEGTHSFAVRAKDAIGNVDSTPAAYTWTVDTTAPDTQIDTHPAALSDASASFTFSSADLSATFECALDGAAFAACASPRDYSALTDGAHTFAVRARDAAGNLDATPAFYTWTVNSAIPVVVSSLRANTNPSLASSLNFTVTFSEAVTGVDTGDFTLTATGITDASITNLTGSGTTYTVTVNTGTGAGTLRLDIVDNDSILNAASTPLGGSGTGNGSYNSGQLYSLRSATFLDVPTSYWSWSWIERVYAAGITAGCGNNNYCPESAVTRAQMAVFLLKGKYGSSYAPPAATGTLFTDVPASNGFAKWIEQLANESITAGCGNGNYCPNASVTRAQMAVFLLKSKHGLGYVPPAATGTLFTDVPASNGFAKWIEQLANEGISGGCGNGNFCPDAPVTRAQMAVFLVKAFNLP